MKKSKRADKRKYHYIYKTTCLITNRFYIGMHSTDNLEDEYIGSGKRLWYSIRKHGKENHKKEILELLPDRKTLSEREKQIINEEMLNDKMCMNIVIGGNGGWDYSRCLIKTYKHSENINKRKIYEKFINLQREKMKLRHKEGKIKYDNFKGKKHTEETKLKMSNIRKERELGIGEKNSQYGTMWITNGVNSIKIKKEYVIPDGWRKGRVIK